MTMTQLDRAHAAMQAAPENDAARLQFYAALADTEVFLMLAGPPEGDQITPELFDIADGQFVLIFDSEDRLAEFAGRPVPYAGLPGRALAAMMAGQGIGLALNLEVAPSAMMIPAAAVDWLVETLSHAPQEAQARLTTLAAPRGLPESLLTGLDRKLGAALGQADRAYLAAATYDNGGQGHVLAFVDPAAGAEQALAHAAAEALRFSGVDAGVLDVLFVRGGDALVLRLEKVGLRLDLPKPQQRAAPPAPGSDPSKPPRLR